MTCKISISDTSIRKGPILENLNPHGVTAEKGLLNKN